MANSDDDATPRSGLAILVKTPGLSAVKTRLAAAIGTELATAFHLASAQAVASVVRHAATVTPLAGFFAVAEEEGIRGRHWSTLPNLPQGQGELGRRLGTVHRQLLARCDCGLLMGADTPQVETTQLLLAADWLSHPLTPRFVLALARDGGFWLFGGNRPLPDQVWETMTCGQADTGHRLLAQLQGLGRVLELPILVDVDHRDDLAPVLSCLTALPHPTVEQQTLAAWLTPLVATSPGIALNAPGG